MRGKGVTRFYVHTAIVEPYLGANGYGEDMFGAPVVLAPPNGCFVDDSRKLVRSTSGTQVVSESTLYTFPGNAPLFPADARVTVNGNVSRVIKTNLNDSGGLGLPDHVAVSLT